MSLKNNEYKLQLNSPWFSHVLTGRKKYEGRRLYGQTLNFKVGDALVFSPVNTPENEKFIGMTVSKTIEAILIFKTFEDGLVQLHNKIDEILPDVKTIKEAVDTYYKYVSLKTQQKDGICFIKLK